MWELFLTTHCFGFCELILNIRSNDRTTVISANVWTLNSVVNYFSFRCNPVKTRGGGGG